MTTHVEALVERLEFVRLTMLNFASVADDCDITAICNSPPAIRTWANEIAEVQATLSAAGQGDLLRVRRADFGEAGLTVRTSKTGAGLVIGWSEGLKRAVLAAVGARDFVPMILLSTEDGRPYTGDGFRTLWHRAMVATRAAHPTLPRFTFNDLRAKAGSDGRDWKLLGHMDQRTFERIYNRLPRQVSPAR